MSGLYRSNNISYLFEEWDYESIPYSHYVVVGTITTVMAIVGAVGNGLVMWGFMTAKSLKTRSHILLLNLAIADFLVSTTSFPVVSVYSFYGERIQHVWVCNLYTLVAGTCGLTSIYTMTFIALERQSVIGEPYKRLGSESRMKIVLCIFSTWAIGFIMCILPILGFGQFGLDGIGTSCTFDFIRQDIPSRSYVTVLFLFGFFIPFTVAVVSYIKICFIVWRHEKRLQQDDDFIKIRVVNKAKQNRRSEVNLAKITFILLTLFCIAWLPYSIVALIGLSGYGHYLNPYITLIPSIFAKASAIYNPVVYVIGHKSFRQKMFRCCLLQSNKDLYWTAVNGLVVIQKKNYTKASLLPSYRCECNLRKKRSSHCSSSSSSKSKEGKRVSFHEEKTYIHCAKNRKESCV